MSSRVLGSCTLSDAFRLKQELKSLQLSSLSMSYPFRENVLMSLFLIREPQGGRS